jgi:CspA family cold shock protein
MNAKTQFTGTVKMFNELKGFGFIECKERGSDTFIHMSQIKGAGGKVLHKGDQVSFTIGEGRKGPEAQNVIVNLRVDGRVQTP